LEDGVGEETKFKSVFVGSRFEWRSIGGKGELALLRINLLSLIDV